MCKFLVNFKVVCRLLWNNDNKNIYPSRWKKIELLFRASVVNKCTFPMHRAYSSKSPPCSFPCSPLTRTHEAGIVCFRWGHGYPHLTASTLGSFPPSCSTWLGWSGLQPSDPFSLALLATTAASVLLGAGPAELWWFCQKGLWKQMCSLFCDWGKWV